MGGHVLHGFSVFLLTQATKDEEVCSELCTLLSQHLRKRLSSIKPDDLFKLTEVHPELLSVATGQVSRCFWVEPLFVGCIGVLIQLGTAKTVKWDKLQSGAKTEAQKGDFGLPQTLDGSATLKAFLQVLRWCTRPLLGPLYD